MIDKLIGFSIRNKLIIGLFTLALVVWGIYSLTRLPIDAVPDITNNQVQIMTNSPTLAAQEVEQFITYPVEQAMATLPDLVEIRSVSRLGLSVVTVVFEDDVDIYKGRQLVFERLKIAGEHIPAGMGIPDLAPVSTGLGEIYQYVLKPQPGFEIKYDATELRTIQDWIVKRMMLGTQGVADVSSFGGFLKQYQVTIEPSRLMAMNVTIADIFKALETNNENTGGAYIEKGAKAAFIRGIGLVKDVSDIEGMVVKNVDGVPVLIRDVAKVETGSAVRYGALTRNGKGEAVGGIVLMLKGENSARVIENVKSRIEMIQKALPEGIVIEAFLDRTKLVDKAINTVAKNLIEGGLIVIFILVILLGNFRAGLVVASVIPLSMLFAIAMMNLFDVSGNLMSLGAIDFGLIVDGAVIIVESIVHRITTDKNFTSTSRLNQNQMDDLVHNATVRIRKSAAFGEIIILIVYLPILALVGIEGKMFRPMAQTVGFAITGALILSLTYVPMMSALCLSKETSHKKNISDRIMEWLFRRFDPIIRKALQIRALIVAFSLALMVTAVVVFLRMGGEFLPTLNEGDLAIEAMITPGSSLSQSVKTFSLAEEILLREFPDEVKEVVSKIGSSEIPTDPMPIESADVMVILKDAGEWKKAETREELIEKMEEALSVVPGLQIEFSQPIQLRFNELITGVKQDIAVKIYGEDLDQLYTYAQQAAEIIQPVHGVGDLKVEQTQGLPQILVTYNRPRIAQYGLSIQEVNRVLNAAFAGATAGVVHEGERRFDLIVRMGIENRKDISDVENLFIPLENGKQIPLREIAEIEFREGAMQISRDDTKRRITIGVNVRDRDVESLVNEIREKLHAQLKLPAGYYITFGGQFENLIAAKGRLQAAVPVSLGMIFVLLFFTFGSVKETLLIFTAIPLSAIGGVFALLIRDMSFSISAGIGFIALFGVAVLNGIVLIGYFNQLKSEGIDDVYQRIIIGTEVRLRPVIMTAAVASLGFLPMALSGSEGSEVQKPLATVVIGGLISSTILTLIVLPVLYSYIEGKGKFRPGKTTLTLVAGFLFLTGLSEESQAQVTSERKLLTLEEAVHLAVTNHPSVKASELEIENQKTLRGTSFNLPKTTIGATYGQTNSFANDNVFSVTQDFAFPSFYAANANLADQNITSGELRASLTKSQLVRDVKLLYYENINVAEQLRLLRFQDSLYSDFSRAAAIRYRTGETAYLEKIAAETRLMEVRTSYQFAKADSINLHNRLKWMIRIEQPFTHVTGNKMYVYNVMEDTAAINRNPYLTLLKQSIEITKAEVKVEKANRLPDFSVGLTSQTMLGFHNVYGQEEYFTRNTRFQYFQVGLGMPLWYRPFKARIKSAEIRAAIAEANLESEKLKVRADFESLLNKWNQQKKSLEFYHNQVLPQSDSIIQFAQKSYAAGEIGYVEFIQNISEGIQIKLNYLNLLKQYNESIINLEFIAGEQH